MIQNYSEPEGFKDVATVVGGGATIDAGIQAAEEAGDREKEEESKEKIQTV